MKRISTFTHGEETVTVTLEQGKRGYNVHAAHKAQSGKGTPKASIGCRQNFKDEKLAVKAFEDLCTETTARGWKLHHRAVRNAFDEIPVPAKVKKPKAAAAA